MSLIAGAAMTRTGLFMCVVFLSGYLLVAEGVINGFTQAHGTGVTVTTQLSGNSHDDTTVLSLPENTITPLTTLNVQGSVGAVTWSSSNTAVNVSGAGVVTSSKLDFEDSQAAVCVIKAVDSTVGTPGTGTVTIYLVLTDVNDNAPRFTDSDYLGHIQDGAQAGTTLTVDGGMVAEDADGTAPNNALTFSHIYPAQTPVEDTEWADWVMDSNTGVITVAPGKMIDIERSYYFLNVRATDTGTPPLAGSCTISVIIERTTAATSTDTTTVADTQTTVSGGDSIIVSLGVVLLAVFLSHHLP